MRTLKEKLEELERYMIEDSLIRNMGHQQNVVRELDISRANLAMKIKKYGFEHLLKANLIAPPKASSSPAIESNATPPPQDKAQEVTRLIGGAGA